MRRSITSAKPIDRRRPAEAPILHPEGPPPEAGGLHRATLDTGIHPELMQGDGMMRKKTAYVHNNLAAQA